MTKKGKGWHRESRRHALASKGVKTGTRKTKTPVRTVDKSSRYNRTIDAEPVGHIGQYNLDDSYVLINTGFDVERLKGDFGNPEALEDLDGFFVQIVDGDYGNVYGFEGTVPYNDKMLYKVVEKQRPVVKTKSQPDYDDVRDVFVMVGGREDALISYSKLEEKFGKDGANALHERGLIYEPTLGKAKLITRRV